MSEINKNLHQERKSYDQSTLRIQTVDKDPIKQFDQWYCEADSFGDFEANAMVTPAHIVPEWYFLSYYTMLKALPNKNAGFILMSTSRVYSIADLVNLEINEDENPKRFTIPIDNEVSEKFSTKPPISLYGSTKLTSELLAIEYGNMYNFPVWINRCGVIAGAGQFGKIDQGIFSFWIYSWLRKNPVKYVGFNGSGKQVRDAIHPNDICKVMNKQIHDFTIEKDPIYNLGGGFHNSMSLKELTEWCYININDDDSHITESKEFRKFDIPVYITNYDKAKKRWDFKPTYNMDSILSEIRDYAINNKSFMEYIHE